MKQTFSKVMLIVSLKSIPIDGVEQCNTAWEIDRATATLFKGQSTYPS